MNTQDLIKNLYKITFFKDKFDKKIVEMMRLYFDNISFSQKQNCEIKRK